MHPNEFDYAKKYLQFLAHKTSNQIIFFLSTYLYTRNFNIKPSNTELIDFDGRQETTKSKNCILL